MRYCRRFLAGIPHWKIGHPCATHPSATPSPSEEGEDVRLACVRHAASVYPEPGSNSPSNGCIIYARVEHSQCQLVELRSRPSCCYCVYQHLAVRRCTVASPLTPQETSSDAT